MSLVGHLSLANGEREASVNSMKVRGHRAKKIKFDSLCIKLSESILQDQALNTSS